MTISYFNNADDFNPVAISLGRNPYIRANSLNGIINNSPTLTFGQIELTPTVLPPNAGIAVSLVSTSASDVGAIIVVIGLGANGILLDPIPVVLNGTTPVSVATMSRINRLFRISGDIVGTVKAYNGANTYDFLAPTWVISRSAHFCCPADWKIGISMIEASLLKNANNSQTAYATIQLEAKPFSSTVFGPIISMITNSSGAGAAQIDQSQFITFNGPFDLRITAKASEANIDVQCFSSIMIADMLYYP